LLRLRGRWLRDLGEWTPRRTPYLESIDDTLRGELTSSTFTAYSPSSILSAASSVTRPWPSAGIREATVMLDVAEPLVSFVADESA
jgi:hypothetical protein